MQIDSNSLWLAKKLIHFQTFVPITELFGADLLNRNEVAETEEFWRNPKGYLSAHFANKITKSNFSKGWG